MSALPSSLAPQGSVPSSLNMSTETAPSRAPASEPASGVSAPANPMAPNGETAEQAGQAIRSKWESEVAPSLQPQGDVVVRQRGPDGKFVARDNANATKPGADYARPADDGDDSSTDATAGAEPRTAPASAPASKEPVESDDWTDDFARTFNVPAASAGKAAKVVADDFGRVMSDFQAGKYNGTQAPAGEAAAASRPSAGQPQPATAPQAPVAGAASNPALEKWSEEDIKSLHDEFDEDTAKRIEAQYRKHNALIDHIAQTTQAQQQQTRAAQERQIAEYRAKTITPFFKGIAERIPKLGSVFGKGEATTQPQQQMQVALLQAASLYQQVKASEGKTVTDEQAMYAAVRNWYPEEFEQEQRTTERRNSNVQSRHRNRDIGAGPASGGRRVRGESLLDVAERFLSGSKSG